MSKQISSENVVRASVTGPARGLAEINKNTIALFTDEVPIPTDFGVSKKYLNPIGSKDDFGSNSDTFRILTAIFGQKKNIMSGGAGAGAVVIPRLQAAPAAPATIIGRFKVNLAALTALDYNINAVVDSAHDGDILIGAIDTTDVDSVETSLNSTAVTAAGLVFVVKGDLGSATIELKTVATGVAADITIGLAGAGTDISPLLGLSGSATGADAGLERNKDAILRTVGSVPYFGIVYNTKMTDADLLETAALVQTLQKFQGVGSNLTADITGIFKTLKDSGYTQTRCLFYSNSESNALDFAAGYMSQLMSINFTGSNTSLTMNLKDYTGLVGDPDIDDDLFGTLKKEGVDCLANLGVVPKIFSFGANLFSDQVYTRLALIVDLQIAGINFLATTGTKRPQTEEGMNGLKGAYRGVFKQRNTAGINAPGRWNDPTTFGKPEDHIRNIEEFGYYIFSSPVADQSQAVRSTRVAPLVQAAEKESGALHESDIAVSVEP